MGLVKIDLPSGKSVSIEDTPENVEALMELYRTYAALHAASIKLLTEVDQVLTTLPLIKKISDADLSSIAELQPVGDVPGPGPVEKADS